MCTDLVYKSDIADGRKSIGTMFGYVLMLESFSNVQSSESFDVA